MKMLQSLRIILAAFLLFPQVAVAEVTVLSNVQVIYDRSPKFRIKITGLTADEKDIDIVLGAQGQTPLKADKDFMLTKDNEGIILKLLANRRWVDLKDRVPPVALFLSSVTFSGNDREQLFEKVMVASVLATPTIEEGDILLYSTASNELRLVGDGLMGAKDVDLFFSPPLLKEIAYEIVSKFPVQKNEIVLRIRHGYEWRESPGPLYLKGIDTGGGAIKIGGDTGVLVATVTSNLPAHQVSVEDTSADQLIYSDESFLTITGSNFNPLGNTLRFANGILGKGVNYTVSKNSESALILQLAHGSSWRGNVENLPGFLTLLAVNTGEGFVAVGPINSGKGRDIATVFERPNVVSGSMKLYRTQTHELHIYGAGFPTSIAKPKFRFKPSLTEGVDYTLRVVSRADVEVTLLDGKNWGKSGPLVVEAVNSRGDDSGWVVFPRDGVIVAEIIDDVASSDTAGVAIYPTGTKIYQSALQRSIDVAGKGFTAGMELSFDPVIKAGIDFDLKVESQNRITLTLKSGKQWRSDEGLLMVTAVTVDGVKYPFAEGAGIRVANVLLDPTVTAGSATFHETQSKVIAVTGTGFTYVSDVEITLKPTDPRNFKVLAVFDDTLRLQLKEGLDWLPPYMTLKADENKKIPLEILSLDTGAGSVSFNPPITIGYIVADIPGVTCDDSCAFAFDGVCDDGSESEYEEYADEYGDDWQENEYGDEEAADEDDYYGVDAYNVAPCVQGTDCTDCGGVDVVVNGHAPLPEGSEINPCLNTCVYARDGTCDDPRGENYCALGTDCQDCGPVGATNFTSIDDDNWYDDDKGDDDWMIDDDATKQADGLEANRDLVRGNSFNDDDAVSNLIPKSTSISSLFFLFLAILVISAGVVFVFRGHPILSAMFRGPRHEHANEDESRPFIPLVPITPDVIRT